MTAASRPSPAELAAEITQRLTSAGFEIDFTGERDLEVRIAGALERGGDDDRLEDALRKIDSLDKVLTRAIRRKLGDFVPPEEVQGAVRSFQFSDNNIGVLFDSLCPGFWPFC